MTNPAAAPPRFFWPIQQAPPPPPDLPDAVRSAVGGSGLWHEAARDEGRGRGLAAGGRLGIFAGAPALLTHSRSVEDRSVGGPPSAARRHDPGPDPAADSEYPLHLPGPAPRPPGRLAPDCGPSRHPPATAPHGAAGGRGLNAGEAVELSLLMAAAHWLGASAGELEAFGRSRSF